MLCYRYKLTMLKVKSLLAECVSIFAIAVDRVLSPARTSSVSVAKVKQLAGSEFFMESNRLWSLRNKLHEKAIVSSIERREIWNSGVPISWRDRRNWVSMGGKSVSQRKIGKNTAVVPVNIPNDNFELVRNSLHNVPENRHLLYRRVVWLVRAVVLKYSFRLA